MKSNFLRIIYRYNGPCARDLWQGFADTLQPYAEHLEGLRLDGIPLKSSKIYERLRSKAYFGIETDSFEFSFGRDGCRKFDSVMIKSKDLAVGMLRELANGLMFDPTAIYGWLVNMDYQFWQNVADMDTYRRAGRSLDGISIVCNGQPKPLTAMIVDISSNPGRAIFHNGHIETVGGIMWFKPGFFDLTGANRGDLLSLPFLRCGERDEVLEVILDEDLLAHAEGDFTMSTRQNILRSTLFPRTAPQNHTES